MQAYENKKRRGANLTPTPVTGNGSRDINRQIWYLMSHQVLLLGNDLKHYQTVRQELVNSGFYVAYQSKARQALKAINDSKPDIVVAAKFLQDNTDIFYLSEQMTKRHIPVIFIADTDDRHTFELAMQAGVKVYFVNKRHNEHDIIRQVQLLIQKQNNQQVKNLQNPQQGEHQIGLAGLTTYLQNIKNMGYNDISRKVVRFEKIIWISNDKKHLKQDNYIWFEDDNGKIYYLKKSLSSIYQKIPAFFARVNDSYIVNLLPDYLDGRINGNNIVVNGQRFNITRTYKAEFEKRFNQLYG